MTYGTIQQVRRLSGKRPQKAYGVSIGDGDASETEFNLPYVGFNEGYVLDQSEQTSATPTISVASTDITVYVDDVPVTVTSIDNEKGSVVLASAPADAGVVTADYWHSSTSDEQILEAMGDAELIVNEIIDGSLVAGQSDTFYYDGDSSEFVFWMQKKDVTAITSLTVNGSTKTAETDFYVYYYDDQIRISYIRFKSPPSASSLKNIVVNVTRGKTKVILVRLSNLYAGKMALSYLPDSEIIGEFKKGNQSSGKIPTSSRLRMLNSEIASVLEHFDGRDILGI